MSGASESDDVRVTHAQAAPTADTKCERVTHARAHATAETLHEARTENDLRRAGRDLMRYVEQTEELERLARELCKTIRDARRRSRQQIDGQMVFERVTPTDWGAIDRDACALAELLSADESEPAP